MNAKQLKNSILQQAIQGKLVPQDPNDEPASVLLERIREEKARLVKEKKIKKEKNPSIIFRGEDNSHYEKFTLTGEVKCIDDERPFDLPKGWEWCRLGEVVELINGRAYKKEELLQKGKYKVLRVGNLFTNNEWFYSDLELPKDKYCYDGDLIYAWSASFGPYIWEGEQTIFHYHIWNVKYNKFAIFRDYLYYFLEYDKNSIRKSTTGTTMIHISMEKMIPRFMPLPPLSEQQRIVEKIEELMPLVEQYGKAQSELEALNSNIREQLKKSILQYAIEGKLVPQCEEDGTAEDLLREIQTEKQRLYAEGKLKKKDLAHSTIFRGEDNKYYEQVGKTCVCIDDEIPFEIPLSWRWVRMVDITNMYTGNSINKETKGALYTNVEGLPYIATKDVGFDKNIRYSNGVAIPYSAVNEFRVAPAGTVLICIEGGSAGRKIGILNQDVCFGNKLCCLHPYKDLTHYIYYYLQSFTFFSLFSENKNGIIGGVSLNELKRLLLPLPPTIEIRKINNKLSQMLQFIER